MRIPFTLAPRTARSFDVVGLGQNSVDLVVLTAEYPAANTAQHVLRFARLPGGQIATALAACARLGWAARYVGRFGGDDLGTLARESLVREGVDVTASQTVADAANRFAVVLVDARTGDRTVLWDRDPKLSMEPGEVPRDVVTSGRLLIVDAQESGASTQAARCAREAGIPTVLDVDQVAPGVEQLLEQIDVVIAAEGFPSALTGYDDPGRALEAMARQCRASIVCVTLGVEGSLARCGGREIRTPARAIDCVDSTGAGDAFRGGFVAGCLRAPGGDLEDALNYATAVAALNCRAIGAQSGLPTPDEVEQLLA